MNQDRMQFKAIHRETKEVIALTGFTLHGDDRPCITAKDYYHAGANVEIIQSIGKRDKNNVLIFDGDIVQVITSLSYEWLPGQKEERLTAVEGYIGVIEYCQESCAYRPVSPCRQITKGLLYIQGKDIEVIGHKLTHPELSSKTCELKKIKG